MSILLRVFLLLAYAGSRRKHVVCKKIINKIMRCWLNVHIGIEFIIIDKFIHYSKMYLLKHVFTSWCFIHNFLLILASNFLMYYWQYVDFLSLVYIDSNLCASTNIILLWLSRSVEEQLQNTYVCIIIITAVSTAYLVTFIEHLAFWFYIYMYLSQIVTLFSNDKSNVVKHLENQINKFWCTIVCVHRIYNCCVTFINSVGGTGDLPVFKFSYCWQNIYIKKKKKKSYCQYSAFFELG